ncbi:hypothetical protein JX265_004292 [Neoarthrinium moseri]|uniref:Uncharacterized protein n=1 Tax=Neoarthrinium moseri TaxID=1658444 RepID=A0A9Q0ASA4_9PEZI|nr:uncharacterized protein JN550_001914 [Neoarthrinium moseri]KAI1850582.1 hypothetical protein JX266_003864 [Neoarthrinium moseri]KAI1875234.1 hypothetical protein JX265_004292 [Neoarthrinium moseri]KAI1875628.1 hypothetical protein JN550_001914 [Neoarthrinium moseri]
MSSTSLPVFNFDFTSTPSTSHHPHQHRPAVSSPLSSSSPIRVSQSSPPLSPRDPNTLAPRRDFNSSPIQPSSSAASSKLFKFAGRDAKKNPLRQSRETAQESKRRLFLKGVRQRADDKAWERRGGDQEVLKLEWSALDRRRRQLKDSDIDGFVFEDELEDIPEMPGAYVQDEPMDHDMMVDSHAQDEEAELEAMLSAFESQSSRPPVRPDSPSLSDEDDYDSLFMDFLTQQDEPRNGQDIVLSGQMDMS